MQSFLTFIFLVSFQFGYLTNDRASDNHAIYLSVVEVSHSKGEGNATMKIKVFSDDMEDAMRNAFNLSVDITDPATCNKNKEQIEAYFVKHLQYSINGKIMIPSLSHCESNGDAIWFYFKLECPNQWKEVSVKADYLMELFPTQSNVVSIYHGDEKRFIKLTKSNPSDVVRF